MFDSLSLNFANWSKSAQFSSSPDNRSYYLNSAFDYQNYKFINVDFNSRNDASPPWFGVEGPADVHSWSLSWINNIVDLATNTKRKLFVLGHHPLITRRPWTQYICFTPHEVHMIADEGLLNNKPLAHWIGGHVHGY
ncbi:MAG: hypothetical protein ABIL74_10745 [candidate division WOR-3 bacterium]